MARPRKTELEKRIAGTFRPGRETARTKEAEVSSAPTMPERFADLDAAIERAKKDIETLRGLPFEGRTIDWIERSERRLLALLSLRMGAATKAVKPAPVVPDPMPEPPTKRDRNAPPLRDANGDYIFF